MPCQTKDFECVEVDPQYPLAKYNTFALTSYSCFIHIFQVEELSVADVAKQQQSLILCASMCEAAGHTYGIYLHILIYT